MSRTPEESLTRIAHLKERVKQAQMSAAGARVHHDDAKVRLDEARKRAEESGFDFDSMAGQADFDQWLDTTADDVESVIEEAERALKKAKEMVADG